MQVDEETSLLEDIFNEPHCESMHVNDLNRACSHKVVATVLYPCGCYTEACNNHVRYSRFLIESGGYCWCNVKHGSRIYSPDIQIIPKG